MTTGTPACIYRGSLAGCHATGCPVHDPRTPEASGGPVRLTAQIVMYWLFSDYDTTPLRVTSQDDPSLLRTALERVGWAALSASILQGDGPSRGSGLWRWEGELVYDPTPLGDWRLETVPENHFVGSDGWSHAGTMQCVLRSLHLAAKE